MNTCDWNVLCRMIEDADASLDEYRQLMSVLLNAYVEEAIYMDKQKEIEYD